MTSHISSKSKPDRRSVIKGIAGGIIGTGLGTGQTYTYAESPHDTIKPSNPNQAQYPIWKLTRPKAALPSSYFWTWDHKTNWMMDDPGMLNFGCKNKYLKQPATFCMDYHRLTDLAAGLGVKGITIWGFLRDSHGGIDYAKQIADYAAAKGVAIQPGVGTNRYGGIYYEGDHKYNIVTFTKQHPDARATNWEGKPFNWGACPTSPRFVEWLHEGLQWLFREFNVGGANLENGDFAMCHCPRCKKTRADIDWPNDEPKFWMYQYLGYYPALSAIKNQLKDKLVVWATYKGFVPGKTDDPSQSHFYGSYMGCQRPSVVDKLPPTAICQWTLTRMLRDTPVPLIKYLDKGSPQEVFINKTWASDIKPPSVRSVGFIHHGKPGFDIPSSSLPFISKRYDLFISSIKETCLRAYLAGLEGVGMFGEVSSMNTAWALNYLAFSHFIHWPEDSLRQFGRKTLGQVFESEDEGEAFTEILAHCEADSLSDAQKKDVNTRTKHLQRRVQQGAELIRWRFWNWLMHMANRTFEHYTVGIY